MAPRLVLDANILVRAVLGKRVKNIIATHAVNAGFFAPEVAYDDAERHLPEILTKNGRADDIGDSLAYLAQLGETVLAVPEEVYLDHKDKALARIKQRTPMTGRFSRPRWHWNARSGPKTTTSSVLESPRGRPTGSRSTSARLTDSGL